MPKKHAIHSYRDLEVWQRGMDLTEHLYAATQSFPDEERFGLTAQLRRAAISVPSNVAEGWGRAATKDYVRFLRIARGSLAEMETQLAIAHRLGYLREQELIDLLKETTIEGKMLLSLIRSLARGS